MESAVAVIFFWLFIGIIAGAIGSSKPIGFFKTFLISILLSPVIAILVVIFSKSKDDIELKQKQRVAFENLASNKPIYSVADELDKLKSLRNEGVLSEEEFDQQKTKLLNQ